MGKTWHGSKGPGYEHWLAQPRNRGAAIPNKFRKKLIHRKERRAVHRQVEREFDD